jgi:O-antigen ligase
MPPNVALLLALALIAWLFWRDFRQKPQVTGALWLFWIWMFLVATRPVSKWLVVFGIHGFGATSVEEGSSFDAFIFLSLIVAAMFVLHRRNVRLSELLQNNPWIAVFICYCFLAIFWSDFPFVSFKRWIKILGHPLMVILLFTEPDWETTLATAVKRCSYILFPISIVWMKYFPALGRRATEWGGMSNTGIAEGKNELGALCLVFILLLLWHLLNTLKETETRERRRELQVIGGLLVMAIYCLVKAHSATSTFSLLLGAGVMLVVGLQSINKRRIGLYLVTAAAIALLAQMMFDVYGRVVDVSGHEETIEGRGRLWQMLLQTDQNPIFGEGFESYWLGPRAEELWEMPEFAYRPNEAHNGYLELYLNLGLVGLGLFVCVIFGVFGKIRQELLTEFGWGRFELGCLVAILAHNWTEAGFKALNLPFYIFFMIAVRYRHPNYPINWDGSSRQAEEGREDTEFALNNHRNWNQD